MDNSSLNRAERLSLQAQWLNARMKDHPGWHEQLPAPRLVTATENKMFLVWRLTENGPQIIETLRATGFEASFTAGLTVLLSGSTTSSVFKVSSYPRELLPGVFAWIPPFCEVRFCPYDFENPDSTWRASVPMLVRTTGGTDPKVGEIMISTSREFRRIWPNTVL